MKKTKVKKHKRVKNGKTVWVRSHLRKIKNVLDVPSNQQMGCLIFVGFVALLGFGLFLLGVF